MFAWILVVLCGFCPIVVGVVSFAQARIASKTNRSHDVGMFVGSGVLWVVVGCLILVAPAVRQLSETISLPPRIAALERTIEQQTALIADNATLGQGLEGLEIKREIQQTIRELNDAIARAEYINASPLWMFKVK